MKIFLATPIAGFESEKHMIEYKRGLSSFFSLLKQQHTVYAEIDKINNGNDYDSPEDSAIHDFGLIKDCDVFIMHYPKKMATSALMELGYAIALQKRIIIIVESLDVLPFLGQGLNIAYTNVVIIQHQELDVECAQNIINIL